MLGILAYAKALPPDLNPGDRLTAVLLFDAANKRTRICWMSMATLAKARGSNARNTINSVHRLLELGIIVLIEKGNGHKANKYAFPDLSLETPQTRRQRHPNPYEPSDPAVRGPNHTPAEPQPLHGPPAPPEPPPPPMDASPIDLAAFDAVYAAFIQANRAASSR